MGFPFDRARDDWSDPVFSVGRLCTQLVGIADLTLKDVPWLDVREESCPSIRLMCRMRK
jgi:hypothetical protein